MANNNYYIGDQYCIVNSVGTTVWYQVTANYTSSSAWTQGTDGGFATPKNIGTSAFGNVSIGGNVNAILVGPITLAAGFTISVTTDSTAYVYGKLLNDSL